MKTQLFFIAMDGEKFSLGYEKVHSLDDSPAVIFISKKFFNSLKENFYFTYSHTFMGIRYYKANEYLTYTV